MHKKLISLVLTAAITAPQARAVGHFYDRFPSHYALYSGAIVQVGSADATGRFLVEVLPTADMPAGLPAHSKLFVPREQLVAEISGEDESSLCSRVYLPDGYIAAVKAVFSNGAVFVTHLFDDREPDRLVNKKDLECLSDRDSDGRRMPVTMVDEAGDVLQTYGFLKDDSVLAIRYGDGAIVKRSPEGLKSAQLHEERVAHFLEDLVKHETFAQAFDDIRSGMRLDLEKSASRHVLFLYAATQLRSTLYYMKKMILESLEEFRQFSRYYKTPDKPNWAHYEVGRAGASNKTLTLRLLERAEAPFRGCLGNDCSTWTRLLRALEPAHLNFAIEEQPGHRPLGQIEIVLGQSSSSAKPLAFLERVQSPANLKAGEIENLLRGLQAILSANGFTLVALENSKAYVDLGHGISNSVYIQHRIDEVFSRAFERGAVYGDYVREQDQFLLPPDNFLMNLIAQRVHEQAQPVYELQPKLPAPELKPGFPRVNASPLAAGVLFYERLKAAAQGKMVFGAKDHSREIAEELLHELWPPLHENCEEALTDAFLTSAG